MFFIFLKDFQMFHIPQWQAPACAGEFEATVKLGQNGERAKNIFYI